LYRGNKLPPFYLGSTSIKRIERGYRGSVASKEYQNRWVEALKTEPEKFTTKIVASCQTRGEAFKIECRLQERLGVVKSPLYVNKSLARKNGFFGGEQRGSANHMFGKETPEHVKRKISTALTGKKKSSETVALMRIARNNRAPLSQEALLILKNAGEKRRGENHTFYGKSRPPGVCAAIAASKIGKHWWTDGVSSRFMASAPSGWVRGMAKRVSKKT
jgi:hypothetical protein